MHDVLIRPVLSRQLVFGLDWLPLISGRASRSARRVARQYKASHIILDGDAPASFGYGLVPRAGRHRRLAMHSAAQNMARLYPSGHIAAIVPIEPDGHWFVAIHEGAVAARTDVVYRSFEQARHALQELQRTHPRLVALLPETGCPSLEAIAGASDSGTLLRNTGRSRSTWLLFVLVLGILASALMLSQRQGAARVASDSATTVDEAQAALRWRQAIEQAEQGITVHGVAATHTVLRHIQEIPARMAGWVLVRAMCRAHAAAWQCSADYDRKMVGANNAGLLAIAPPGWRFDFSSIDRAQARWVLQAAALPLVSQHIDAASHNRRYLQSAWQGIRPAFNKIEVGPAQPVGIEPPRDGQGRALPRPAGLRSYARRQVMFEGPLRSISVLLPHTRSIGWRSITLTQGDVGQPSLASSQLRVSFLGDLYEFHQAEPAQAQMALQ